MHQLQINHNSWLSVTPPIFLLTYAEENKGERRSLQYSNTASSAMNSHILGIQGTGYKDRRSLRGSKPPTKSAATSWSGPEPLGKVCGFQRERFRNRTTSCGWSGARGGEEIAGGAASSFALAEAEKEPERRRQAEEAEEAKAEKKVSEPVG